jgi:hypothetical protein
MSRIRRAAPWPRSPSRSGLGLLPLLAVVAVIGLGPVSGALAEPTARAVRVSADQARRAGVAVEIVRLDSIAPGLVEVRSPNAGANLPGLLAVAVDASAVALADHVGQDAATLAIVNADGSQLQVAFPGLLAATFSPDAASVAVVDGLGQLWRVEATDGSRRLVAAGPLLGPLTVEPDGSVLALRVASVEAPFTSHLVRVAQDGSLTTLSSEDLAYGVSVLDDGSLAVIAHRPDGTVVSRLTTEGEATVLANLGPGAVNVAVSPDAVTVAFERAGDVLVRPLGDGPPGLQLKAGSNPRFLPGGEMLLVSAGGGTKVISTDGTAIATLGPNVGLAGCVGRCAS